MRHISYLMVEHSFVAVPGLGVFRRTVASPRFNDGVLKSPKEDVVFEAMEVSGDKSLAMSVARSLSCSYEAAAGYVAADVSEVKSHLSAGRKVAVGRTGFLVPVAGEGGVAFEPSAIGVSLEPTMWLRPVSVLDEVSQASEEKEAEVTERRSLDVFMKSLQRTASAAAALALLVLIAFVAAQLPGRKAAEPQIAGFDLGLVEPIVNDSEELQPLSEKALVLILNTPSDGMSIVTPEEKRESAVEPDETSDCYFLVVASLASLAEAEAYINSETGDTTLSILEADNRFRVYAASGATFAQTKAAAESKNLFDHYPSAWICRK